MAEQNTNQLSHGAHPHNCSHGEDHRCEHGGAHLCTDQGAHTHVPADPRAGAVTHQSTSGAQAGCTTCGGALKSGMKYQDICLTCEPAYTQRCGGCQRILWDCMCIKPHTWE